MYAGCVDGALVKFATAFAIANWAKTQHALRVAAAIFLVVDQWAVGPFAFRRRIPQGRMDSTDTLAEAGCDK